MSEKRVQRLTYVVDVDLHVRVPIDITESYPKQFDCEPEYIEGKARWVLASRVQQMVSDLLESEEGITLESREMLQ